MRTCEHCETFMLTGWINEGTEEYFCSTDCLEVYYPDYLKQLTGRIYYTDWNNETEVYLFDGVQYVNHDDAMHRAYINGFNYTHVATVNYNPSVSLYEQNFDGELVEVNIAS
ncbi:hypothetical protein NSQ62_08030 [Solibacillus sp. FSL H8-0523]|uniref:hypothetical protein n=1 Tax=Solibacillus sp. FSL H8-0523 TaxID=2954511 RepID=UPI003100B234